MLTVFHEKVYHQRTLDDILQSLCSCPFGNQVFNCTVPTKEDVAIGPNQMLA